MKEIEVVHGIVLKSDICNEADVRCRLLTPEGIKTATATGAVRPKAKLKNAVQLFSIAEFTLTGAKITGAHVLQSGMSVTREMHRYYLACAICETILKTNLGNENTATLFLLTAHSFDSLANTDISAYKILLSFFTKLLVILGYDIGDDNPALTKIFDGFKTAANNAIDDIALTHTQAKQCIKLIDAAYKEHLDFSIPCLSEF